ncbi:MAG: ras GTPase, partial [Paramarteilia canceri]
ESFHNVNKWFDEVKENTKGKPITILVGTKSDLEDKILVDETAAAEMAAKHHTSSVFVKSKNNQDNGVEEAFLSLAKQIKDSPQMANHTLAGAASIANSIGHTDNFKSIERSSDNLCC